MLQQLTSNNKKLLFLKKKKFNISSILYIVSLFSVTFSSFIKEIIVHKNDISLLVSNPQDLTFLLFFLKNHFKCQYKELVDICAVDYYFNLNESRYALNYSLLSLKYKIRLRLKVYCDALSGVFSSTQIFSAAGWLEREIWDMFGIFFKNHFDLRRILTDYGFEGFPFRKDFPLSGYVELRYDSEKRIVIYDLLELTQEFRFFEFINPWLWSYNK